MTRAERYEGILGWFAANVPVAETELHYRDVFQLLVATILSAQCTDKRVNMTTPALFERFPTPQAMAAADEGEILEYIKSISYPNSKARHLSAMARKLMSDYGGRVPESRAELMKLPGVGRKTANVVGAVAFDQPVMAVDTHVFRVANRTGLAVDARTPLQVELQLTANIPPEIVPRAHHWLILHGRYVCLARKPRCEECGIARWCRKRRSDLASLKRQAKI